MTEHIKIESFADTEKYINILMEKFEMISKLDDISDKLDLTNKKLDTLTETVDKNTLALRTVYAEQQGQTRELQEIKTAISGGFNNIGSILQEISNKLDKS